TLSFFSREKGLAPYGIFEARGASLGTRRFLGSALYDSRDDLGPGGRLRLTAYAGTTEQRFRDLNHEFAYQATSTLDRNLSVGVTATGTRPLGARLRLAATVDARHERFAPFDAVSSVRSATPGTRAFGAVGAEAHTLWGPLELLPSFRLEAVHDEIIDLTLDRYQDAS